MPAADAKSIKMHTECKGGNPFKSLHTLLNFKLGWRISCHVPGQRGRGRGRGRGTHSVCL